jgi:hypothetical protein
MSKNFTPFEAFSLRPLMLVGLMAVAAAAVEGISPASAAFRQGGGFHSHSAFGGGFHERFDGLHHRFVIRFAFGSFGYFPGYANDDYAPYDSCLRRVWGSYGWHVANVCY